MAKQELVRSNERRDVGGELEPTVSLTPAVTLDEYGVRTTVGQLESLRDVAARILIARIRKEWRYRRSDRDYITLRLTPNELDLVRQAGGNNNHTGDRYQWVAIFRHEESGQEVKLRSIDRPPKKRSFRVPGRGKKRFKRVRLFRITTKESTVPKAKTKKKAVEDDELESLEELEELEEEEPDDDSEEDEDEEEDEAPPKRKRKAAKKSTKTKSKKSSKKKAAADDEDEDEDEDEEEEAPKKKSKKGAKKGGKKGKGKKGGTKTPGKSTKEMTGGVGSAELAAAASEIAETEITGRDVRVYLRKNEIPKDEEHGRYVWPSENNKEFKKLAKAIAAEYEDDE